MVADRFRTRDLEFLAHKQENAGISFAEYNAHKHHRDISAGGSHYSLGANLRDDSVKTGEEKARYYFKAMSLKPGNRVIDYGWQSADRRPLHPFPGTRRLLRSRRHQWVL